MQPRTEPAPARADEATSFEARRGRRRVRRLRALGALLVGAALFSGYFHRPLFLGNLGVVEEGLVYRSAQPTGDVVGLIRRHRLGSILNLRGGKDDDPWYAAEVRAAAESGVEFWDVPLSAVRRPTRRELLAVLDVLDRSKKPLLIHCKSGSDRTGLAAGLYLMAHRGVPPSRAESAFMLAHAHVPLFGPERLHEPFAEYAAWLARGGLAHSPEHLLDWVTRHYRADDPPAESPPIQPGPRARRPR